MEEERVMAFGALDKPLHGVCHVLLRWNLAPMFGVIREKDNVLSLEAIVLWRTS